MAAKRRRGSLRVHFQVLDFNQARDLLKDDPEFLALVKRNEGRFVVARLKPSASSPPIASLRGRAREARLVIHLPLDPELIGGQGGAILSTTLQKLTEMWGTSLIEAARRRPPGLNGSSGPH